MNKIFSFYLVAIFIFSCEDETPAGFILRIKENKIKCTGYECQTECYLAQEGSKIDSREWDYFYEEIEGFVYEPGFVYKLLVIKEPIKNPPADHSNIKYTLKKELSKEPKVNDGFD